MRVLEDFYYGELNPFELCSKLDDELKNLMMLKSRNEENLVGTLTEKQKCDFEKYKDCEQEYSQLSEKKSFLVGFKLGARIIIDAIS